MKKRMAFFLVACLGAFLPFEHSNNLYADTSKNIILVLDTSLSMVGYGGKNILDKVKEKINTYIDRQIYDGDKLTFVTFDEGQKVYDTVLIDDKNDRDILKKFINKTEARGKWTYTLEMIQIIYDLAEKLQNEDPDRQVVIVIMTDALDDPPPGSEKSRLDISKISQKKDWWVYLIDLGNLKGSKMLDRLNKQTEFAKHRKVIAAGQDLDKGMGDLNAAIKETEKKEKSIVVPVLIAIIVIAALIILLVLLRRNAQTKVSGRLEFWNHTLIRPYFEETDLTKRNLKQVLIGKGSGAVVRIRDLDAGHPFGITAVRSHGAVKMRLIASADTPIDFVNKNSGEFLEEGDMFKVANYSFKYFKS